MAETSNILIYFLVLNTLVFMFTPIEYQLIPNEENMLNDFFTLHNETGDITGINEDFNNTIPRKLVKGGNIIADTINTISGIVDGMAMVWDTIAYILNFMLTPVSLMVRLGFPQEIKLLFGVPLVIAYIIGIINFIGGKREL